MRPNDADFGAARKLFCHIYQVVSTVNVRVLSALSGLNKYRKQTGMTRFFCFKTGGNRADPTCWIAVPRDIPGSRCQAILWSDLNDAN
jgi:hypothetical protein